MNREATEPSVVYWLGYSGLIPFVVLSIWLALNPTDALAKNALGLYGFGIFSFLCGAWWLGDSPARKEAFKRVLSNVLFLIAFFAMVFFEAHQLWVLAALFVVLYGVEHHSPLFYPFNPKYRLMRQCLTSVVAVSLLVAFWSIAL